MDMTKDSLDNFELSEEDFFPPEDKRIIHPNILQTQHNGYSEYVEEFNEYISDYSDDY